MIFDELLEFNTKNGGQFITGICIYTDKSVPTTLATEVIKNLLIFIPKSCSAFYSVLRTFNSCM